MKTKKLMITFKQFIEKRSHPELNPKLSAYELLKPYSDKENYYISFTAKDKLGINPKSGWRNTPIGVYTYPIKETWKEYNVEVNKDFSGYPYASNLPYIWLIKPKNDSNVLDSAKVTQPILDAAIEKMLRYDSNVSTLDKQKEIELIKKEEPSKCRQLIVISQLCANDWSWDSGYRYTPKKNMGKWNKVLVDLGYDVISDKGLGVLVATEPYQAVFLKPNSYIIIDEILNKKR